MRGKVGIEILTEHVPEHQLEASGERTRLRERDPAVRRTEQAGPRELLAVKGVAQVFEEAGFPSAEMVEGMVAHPMAFGQQPLEHVGVALDVPPDAEEGGLGMVLLQGIEHPWSDLRDGAVVEREVEHFFPGSHTPHPSRPERPPEGHVPP